MREKGFSLVELIVVLVIIGILLTIVTLNFNEYTKKANIEAQVKTMYSDLMTIRTQALFQKKGRSITLSANGYAVYSTNNVAAGVGPKEQKSLSYPIIWNNSAQIDFNERGMLDVPATGNRSICVNVGDNPAGYDSIVISTTRIKMGKKTGVNCDTNSIDTK